MQNNSGGIEPVLTNAVGPELCALGVYLQYSITTTSRQTQFFSTFPSRTEYIFELFLVWSVCFGWSERLHRTP